MYSDVYVTNWKIVWQLRGFWISANLFWFAVSINFFWKQKVNSKVLSITWYVKCKLKTKIMCHIFFLFDISTSLPFRMLSTVLKTAQLCGAKSCLAIKISLIAEYIYFCMHSFTTVVKAWAGNVGFCNLLSIIGVKCAILSICVDETKQNQV